MKYPYRGLSLDVSRHFFDVDEIKKLLRLMNRLEMNELHLHLSDDQGYRLESRTFPKLNQIGSYRKEIGSIYGGYYTWEQVDDLVSYASALEIEIVPEIDIPGHTTAIIAAYPELSCSSEPVEVVDHGGVFTHILCPGKNEVVSFCHQLLDEVIPHFPGRYFHLGGDEAPKTEWEKCPYCQQRIKEAGLKDEEELQEWLTDQISSYLENKGKTVIGWNDGFTPEKPDTGRICQYWNEEGPSRLYRSIGTAQKFIFSNNPAFYFDYSHGMIPASSPLAFKPEIAGHQGFLKDQIMGIEATIWTETIKTNQQLEEQLLPRLISAALVMNGEEGEKDLFNERFNQLIPFLESEGFSWTSLEKAFPEKEASEPEFIAQAEAAYVLTRDELPEAVRNHFIYKIQRILNDFTLYSYTEEEREKLHSHIYRDLISRIAKKAGLIMLEAEDIRHQIKEKSGHANFVTVYDERVQEYLFKELKKIIPDASFVGEEEGAEIFKPEYEQGYTFCIDPIDGTSNFLTGYRPSVISIALFKDGNPYVSVVYEPYQDLLFTAIKGEGAFLNGKQLESSREPLARSLVSFGTSPYDPELMDRSFELCKFILPKCIDLRRSGSAVWDICQVAMGVTGMFFECKLRLWDFAAASLILEEAGGRITDMNGEKLSLRRPSSILAISQGVAAEGLKRLDF